MKLSTQRAIQATRGANTTGWQERHKMAVQQAAEGRGHAGAAGLIQMIGAWHDYADAHVERFESRIGEDGVLGPAWADIGKGLRMLLNGDSGVLDCGTLDGFILKTAAAHGVDENEL